MEELTLYIWSLSETRGVDLGHKSRYPARSAPLKSLRQGMDLSELFESASMRRQHRIILEELGTDYVKISCMGDHITLHKGERYTSRMLRTDNIYIAEYIGLEIELDN